MRKGRDPKRHIAPANELDRAVRRALDLRIGYTGSAHHKLHAGNYGFQPPANPRATKSVCDGLRNIRHEEARGLLRAGIMKGMVSREKVGDFPKYVWTVDAENEAYEAKIINGTNGYKGYRLENEDDMRAEVLKEWAKR